ncbi:hypothetical protein ABPG74_005591 [Tetrahymena malaccensis]
MTDQQIFLQPSQNNQPQEQEFQIDTQEYQYYQYLNEQCYKSHIYFCGQSDKNASDEQQGTVFYQQDNYKTQQTIPKQLNTFFSDIKRKVLDKLYSYNIIVQFFALLLIFLVVFGIFSPISIIFLIKYYYKKYKEFSKVEMLLIIIFLLFALDFCCFFIMQIIYLVDISNNEENKQFKGISLLTFCGFIYSYSFLVGIAIYIDFSRNKSESVNKDALQGLFITSNYLFFELMDRNNINNFLEQPTSNIKLFNLFNYISAFSQKPHISLDLMTNSKQIKTIQKKWNQGFQLLARNQPSSFNNFIMIKRFNFSVNIFMVLLTGLIFFLQIYYLSKKAQSWFDVFDTVFIIFANYFTCFCTYLNYYMMTYTYEGFSKIETFTSLLENSINCSEYQFKRSVSTLNIYCQHSISTWFETRQLMLNINEKFFRYMNLPQSLEVVCFLTLSGILFMDYIGLGWNKYEIIQNDLLLSLFLINIFLRLVIFIYPIFNNFSYVNDLLLYNQQQVQKICKMLSIIEQRYAQLRKSIYQSQSNIQDEENTTMYDLKQNSQIQNLSTHEIQEQRAIFEIQRNALLYSDQLSLNASSKDLTDAQRINIEKKYLSELIIIYKSFIEEMEKQEDKHQIKFLGIFTISYIKAKALAILAISPLLSFIFKFLQT